MFKRIMYHFRYKPFTYISQLAMYVFLAILFISTFLTTQLSNVLDSVLSQNADMHVSVYSSITAPLQKQFTENEFFEKEREYIDSIQDYARQDGIRQYDLSVSMQTRLLKPIRHNQDGTSDVYTSADIEFPDMYKMTLKGVSSTNIHEIRNANIMVYRKNGSDFFTQNEVKSGEMVCFIPAEVFAKWHTTDSNVSQTSDVFTVSTEIVDDNQNVVAYKEWNLNVVGTYLLSSGMGCVENEDGTMELPIYIPLKTLERIKQEAIQFQKDNAPDTLNQIIPIESMDYVHPVTFEMQNLDTTENLIKYIQQSSAYKSNEIQINSSLIENAPVYTYIYAILSSFSSMIWIIGIVTILFVIVSTCIHCLKNRGELTLLQSLGEKQQRLTMQMTIETAILISLSACIAFPISLVCVRKFGVWLFQASISDRNVVLNQSIKYAFSLNEIHISTKQMQSMLKMTPYISLNLIGYICISSFFCFLVCQKMIRSFRPRQVFGGED